MATQPSKTEIPKNTEKTAEPSKAAGISAEITKEICAEAYEIFEKKQAKHGTEYDLVRQFLESHSVGLFDERILPQSSADTIVKEYSFRHGRAGIILFHTDGSATIIEAKDGTKGYTHVVAGIGQCSLYAAQLGSKPGAVRFVRRALMWTSVGSIEGDENIEDACYLAKVIPLPYPRIGLMMATRMASEAVLTRRAMASEEEEHGSA